MKANNAGSVDSLPARVKPLKSIESSNGTDIESVSGFTDAVLLEVDQYRRERRWLRGDKQARSLIRNLNVENLSHCYDEQRKKLALKVMRAFVKENRKGGQQLLGQFLNRGKSQISELVNNRKPMNIETAKDVLLVFGWVQTQDNRKEVYQDALLKCLGAVQKQKFPKSKPTHQLNRVRLSMLQWLHREDWLYALYRSDNTAVLVDLAEKSVAAFRKQRWAAKEGLGAIELIQLAYDWFDLLVEVQCVLDVREVAR